MKKVFSLIELMIAIVIISLLTTILSFQLSKTLDDTRNIKAVQDLDKIKGIVLQYQSDVLFTRQDHAREKNLDISKINGSFCTPVIFDNNEFLTETTGEASIYIGSVPPVSEGHLSGEIIPEGIRIQHLMKRKYIDDIILDPWGNEYSFVAVSKRPGFNTIRKFFSPTASPGTVIYYFSQWRQNPNYNIFEGDPAWCPFLELFVGCTNEDIKENFEDVNVYLKENGFSSSFFFEKGYWIRIGVQKYESVF